MAGLPYIKFYPGDWLRDDVSACSLAAQGLWLRMMMVAHESANYGFLEVNGAPMPHAMIARKCGCGLEEFETLFAELESAGVPSRASNTSVYSRRMVRDGVQGRKNSKTKREAGTKGAEARWGNRKEECESAEDNSKQHGKTMANEMAYAISEAWQNNASSESDSSSDSKKEFSLSREAEQVIFPKGYSDGFRRWWKTYPEGSRSAMSECWKLWQRIVFDFQNDLGMTEHDAEEHLIRRTKMFAESPMGQFAERRWSAETFLGKGHYNDGPKVWEKTWGDKKSNNKKASSDAVLDEAMAAFERGKT